MNARYGGSPVALVVNSHHAVRRALCERIRASFANFQVLEATTMEDALYMVEAEQIDVVLIDGEGGGISGLKGTRAILERSPKASVIVMSSYGEPAGSGPNRSGAMAFVSKRAIGSELMQVLEDLMKERQAAQPDGKSC
jgi:DNA-binding NarL/FixJ family response regulator